MNEKEKKNGFWISKVKVFNKVKSFEIENTLNEFYKEHFVIATQLFILEKGVYDVVVYYKVKPEEVEENE